LNELTIDIDEAIAASCKDKLNSFLWTICIEGDSEGRLISNWIELEALAWQFPACACELSLGALDEGPICDGFLSGWSCG
jgi:hypothetical protein